MQNQYEQKYPFFSLGRITLWYCGYVARAYRACIIGLLDVVGVLYIIYLVPAKATVIVLSTKMHPSNVGRGDKICFILILPSSPPTLVGCIFVLKIITVALTDTKYMICNTPTTPSTCPANSSYIHATIP
jgi:hypothetical protein